MLTKINLIVLLFGISLFGQISRVHKINLGGKSVRLINRYWAQEGNFNSGTIFSIAKDSSGFIWLAAGNSLIRFDGQTFQEVNFRDQIKNTNGRLGNLFVNKKGDLIFSLSDKGLIRKSGWRFYVEGAFLSNPEFISEIKETSTGAVYIGTLTNGLFKIYNNKYINIKNPNSKINNVSSIAEDSSGYVFAAVNGDGIYSLKDDALNKKQLVGKLNSNWVKKLYFDKDNNLWVGSQQGFQVFECRDGKIGKEISSGLKGKLVRNFAEDSEGYMWIITLKNGVYISDGSRLVNLNSSNLLSGNQITDILIENGNVWLTTWSSGLNLVRKSILNVLGKEDGLTSEYVNSLYEYTKGRILIGTNSGVFDYNENSGSIKKLPFLSDSHIYAFGKDSRGRIYIGTRLGGLFIIDKNKIIGNFNARNGLPVNFIRAIFIDKDKTVWAGTNSGGICLIRNNKIIRTINTSDGLSNNFISFIDKDKKENYLIGTSGGGMNIIHPDWSIEILNDTSGLPQNVVSSILMDESGDYWLSFNPGGILNINKNGIESFTKKDGLYSDKILNLVKDRNGGLWCTTPNGFFTINANSLTSYRKGFSKKLQYRLFTKEDGLLSNRCAGASRQSAIISEAGKIYISTIRGLAVIDSAGQVNSNYRTLLIFDRIINNGKDLDTKGDIVLPPGAELTELKFSAINYNNRADLKFKYKLNGYDKNWIYTTDISSIRYSKLTPGEYKFNIAAYSAGQPDKKETLHFNLKALPFVWQTKWFGILAGLLLLAAIFIIIKYYYTKKYTEQIGIMEMQNALEKERVRISNDMHDDLGASLTKISLLSEIAKSKVDKPEEIKEFLEQISNSGRELAASLDEIVWAVNPKNDKLDKLIFYLYEYANDFLSGADISVEVEFPEDIPRHYISADKRHNIFSVFKECFTNILKHSKADMVLLKFECGRQCSITIEDNGIGINFEKISDFSNGLKNMRKRMESIGGKISFNNRMSGGLKTVIIFNY